MIYKVTFRQSALKSLKRLPKFHSKVILSKIERLAYFSPNTPNIKALKGELQGSFRLRVGDYRVVFEVHQEIVTVVIVEIFHRGKGY